MAQLRPALRLLVGALQGVPLPARILEAWRIVPDEGPSTQPLDPSRSRRYTGRWHNPRTTLALYTALGWDTALREYTHRRRHPFPAIAVKLRMMINHVFDLTDPDVASRLPFALARCLEDTDWSRLRGSVVGDAAVSLGAGALLAPCVQGPDPCACLYMVHQSDFSIAELDRARIQEDVR